MLNNKFFITIVCLLLTVFAFVNANSNPTKEGFLTGFAMGKTLNRISTVGNNTRPAQSVMNQTAASLSAAQARANLAQQAASTYGVRKGDMYQVPPNFQATLAPRMYAGSYGANINYDVPSMKNLAVPADPLTFANMAKENFQGCKAGVGRGNGSLDSTKTIPPPGYTASNYSDLQNALSGQTATSELPVGNMETVNAQGVAEQVFTVNTLMFSPMRSRLYSQGDAIRGDVPIVPDSCKTKWFNVAVNPAIDLRMGAMNIMAGRNEASTLFNETVTALNGGLSNDVYASVNMASQKDTTTLGASRGVSVTAFP
jgi:hypothetical protein